MKTRGKGAVHFILPTAMFMRDILSMVCLKAKGIILLKVDHTRANGEAEGTMATAFFDLQTEALIEDISLTVSLMEKVKRHLRMVL